MRTRALGARSARWLSRAASVTASATVVAVLGPTAPAAAEVSGTSVDPLFPVTGLPFDGQVATFRATFGSGPFTATISWGDGSAPSTGTIGAPRRVSPGVFVLPVSGTHTYTRNGTYRVRVTVSDATGSSQTASNTATATDCFCVNKFPRVGRTVDIGPVRGRSFIRLPGRRSRAARAAQKGGSGFVPLRKSREIPVGTLLDTRRGAVVVLAATGTPNQLQGGRFSQGLFELRQSRRKGGLVTLRITRPSTRACGPTTRGRAAQRRSRRVLRRLRTSVKGRFRTRGRHSAATVRGTDWTTTERCDGTLTRVHRGSVTVRDFRRQRSVVVRAGRSYLARAPR